ALVLLPKGHCLWAPADVRAVAAGALAHARCRIRRLCLERCGGTAGVSPCKVSGLTQRQAHTRTTIERRFEGCRVSSRRMMMMKRSLPLSGEVQCPPVLRHLQRLTRSFVHEGQRISYIHVYARPVGPGREPPLAFITAQDSGFEGIACVDDAARAAILALCVHEDTGSAAALRLARDWLGFVTYMQEPDGRFTDFVADGAAYFRDYVGRAEVALWGYHQLQAVAQAARLFSRRDYVAACASTVRNLVEPVVDNGFYYMYPSRRDLQCAYCVSTLVL